MDLTSLLVNLDRTRACAGRADAALALARACDAHLMGLFCVGRLDMTEGLINWPDFRNLPPGTHDRDFEQATETLQDFSQRATDAGVSHETRRTQAPVELIDQHLTADARNHDLTILGQYDPDDPPVGGRHVTEHVMLASGGPTVVVPYIGPVRDGDEVVVGKRVMVAWDAGREATRAVHDALPILQRAEHVDLLTAAPLKGAAAREESTAIEAFTRYLDRHDVRVQVHDMGSPGIGVGATILNRDSDFGTDLLVMGGYGHGYMRELVLGGVTRHILEQMTVPVLMSH